MLEKNTLTNLESHKNYYKNPFFSIITPVFNGDKYLDNYFNSLITQDFKHFEVIIVNDGSTDNSLNIINKYITKLNNLIIINQPNSGQGIARNKALAMAKGEYILFIDSDDTLANQNSLNSLHNFIVKNPSDIIIFAYKKLYGKNFSKIPKKQPAILQNKPIHTINEKVNLLFNKKIGGPWNKTYNNHFIKKHSIKFAEYLKYEDAYFFWQIIIYANKINFFNEIIYLYRKHNLATMRNNNKNNLDIVEIYSLILDLLKKENIFNTYYTIFLYRALNSFLSLFKKTPYKYKKDFFILIKDFIVKYSINSYTWENDKLNIKLKKKLKKILKALNTKSFTYFYIKSFLL